ncbi:GAF domain-containing protein [Halorussus aquaticus]|uniref:GAF domain-containing protein n=1 Tax=Halorussus aquaticus TaxID=2953748 RepID=A0ABD5PYU0_9EURY|nr:GAF domain-containing protein [Halorussus aquaticus]
MRTVLCVDPDDSARAETAELLRTEATDLRVLQAASLADAVRELNDEEVDCVVTEYELPDGTGLELAARARDVRPDIGCVLYTATDRAALDTDETTETVTEYVAKDGQNSGETLWNLVDFTSAFRPQTPYPMPQDEEERLDALDAYDVDAATLQTDVERITDLAAQYLDVPMASVNMIREHSQQFLVCHGADWTPTPREDSICTYAIVEDGDVTVIEDVKADPRFEHNESLDDMNIRSYAGADLTTSDGLTIGTLCAYDEEPRTFTDDDREYLSTLADVTVNVLDLHLEVAQLKEDRTDERGVRNAAEEDGGST